MTRHHHKTTRRLGRLALFGTIDRRLGAARTGGIAKRDLAMVCLGCDATRRQLALFGAIGLL